MVSREEQIRARGARSAGLAVTIGGEAAVQLRRDRNGAAAGLAVELDEVVGAALGNQAVTAEAGDLTLSRRRVAQQADYQLIALGRRRVLERLDLLAAGDRPADAALGWHRDRPVVQALHAIPLLEPGQELLDALHIGPAAGAAQRLAVRLA